MRAVDVLQRLGRPGRRKPNSNSDGRYRLVARTDRCSIGFAEHTGTPVVVVELASLAAQVHRLTQGLALRTVSAASFTFRRSRWKSAAAIIECRSERFLPSFSAFVESLSDRLPTEQVSIADVLAVFEEWEALFARAGRLTTDEELGLWGELWFILQSKHVDRAVGSWVAAENPTTDFFGAGIGIEVKASLLRLRHHISLIQVEAPVGDASAYFVSLWVAEDRGSGSSLGELIDDVGSRCLDRQAFEKKLLSRGYSHEHRDVYVSKFLVLEEPHVFQAKAIPRVRQVDSGVSRVRYVATLDPSVAERSGRFPELVGFLQREGRAAQRRGAMSKRISR